ncbi:MAG: glutamine--tRNA ligase/YqeY domain fusion protein [Bacteroidota bacterium]
MSDTEAKASLNFIEEIIVKDLEAGKITDIQTRFPPEPNGYLHIGHAKAITVNFELAKKYGGKCNLRFDDTNPVKEDTSFVEGMREDIQWLGFQWDEEHFASDYFEQLYEWAVQLIRAGKAYVDDSTQEEIRAQRGVPTRPGTESPYRNRSVEENLDLFARMRAGEFDEGTHVVRAKIDMASPNMHLRDPIMYRILHAHHHRTGDKWHIYPTYDWAHGQSDSIENVTHSLCSLEFVVHRPLYDWFIEQLGIFPSHQYEFARLNLNYTVMSKRKFVQLIEGGYVNGWDDPRMPTLRGFRRRGYTASAIREFVIKAGVTTTNSVHDMSLLESVIRNELNKSSDRVMTVLDPLKVVITNWDADKVEEMEVENNPELPERGSRKMPFSRVLYIERADFLEDAPRKFFRLAPGREVRCKGAYAIKCEDFIKDESGKVVELHCTYDPATRSGADTSGRKIKGTIHWVSAEHALDVEVREYDRLFTVEDPDGEAGKAEDKTFLDYLNPDSLRVITAKAEPSLKRLQVGDRVQFMRKGYYVVDPDTAEGKLVFNRTVGLRDSWKKKGK